MILALKPILTTLDPANKFWSCKKVMEAEQRIGIFKFDKLKFIKILYSLGFRRYDYNGNYFYIVIENTRILKQVNRTQIIDSFIYFVNESHPEILEKGIFKDNLLTAIYNQLTNLFNDDLLTRLVPEQEIRLNKDTQHEKFLYFENCFVSISKTGYKKLSYEKLPFYIWETEILKRNFKPADSKAAVFKTFCNFIAGNSKRQEALYSIIGYNLHDYQETRLKATVLTDSRISADDEANGRTGKTLFCKALGQIICPSSESKINNTWCEINGKDFDPRNKNKYQTAGIETKIIILNDVRKGFDIEVLFNDITEGVTVEKKNQHPFKIRPKLIVTTNKTIKIEGESAKDRFLEFEFSEYFHKAHSPEDEFKHWFFRDWTETEFNRFDCFIIECIQIYFLIGLKEAPTINLKARKLIDSTNADFLEWIEQAPQQSDINRSLDAKQEIIKKDWFNDFILIYPDYANKLKQSTFSRWITAFCKLSDKGLSMESKYAGGSKGHILIFTKK